MIVGGFELHLYCDNDKHIYLGNEPAQFVGETRDECYREAREKGWKILHKKRAAYCPKCAKTVEVTRVKEAA